MGFTFQNEHSVVASQQPQKLREKRWVGARRRGPPWPGKSNDLGNSPLASGRNVSY